MDTLTIILIAAAFPIVFWLFWRTICWLIARTGGWSRLAERYTHDRVFTGPQWSFQSARLGWANYSAVLTVGADRTGLYLAPFFLFRTGHPPLFVPWREISASTETFLYTYYVLDFKEVPPVRLKIYKRLGERLEEAAGGLPWRDD